MTEKEKTIEWLKACKETNYRHSATIQNYIDIAISALSAEPNKGEWIAYDHGMGLVYLKCPFCGVFIDKRYVEHNFCGKCGAKLSGEKSGFER